MAYPQQSQANVNYAFKSHIVAEAISHAGNYYLGLPAPVTFTPRVVARGWYIVRYLLLHGLGICSTGKADRDGFGSSFKHQNSRHRSAATETSRNVGFFGFSSSVSKPLRDGLR